MRHKSAVCVGVSVAILATFSGDTFADAHAVDTRSLRSGQPPPERTIPMFTGTQFPFNGAKVGVGVIPTITFSRAIPEATRKSVIGNLAVTSSPKRVAGSWRWLDDRNVAYRPKKLFWPGRTTVTVTANLTKVNIPGLTVGWWGAADLSATWKTKRATVVRINSARHSGTLTIGRNVVRKFGVSTGKKHFITRSGIKTITEKIRKTRMTNIGITEDEAYDLEVPYAMRVTYSGEFLHGAPWNSRIGIENRTHGCINLRVRDAKVIFRRVTWGDPVITTGTKRPMEPDNGPGARWNIRYRQWANTPV